LLGRVPSSRGSLALLRGYVRTWERGKSKFAFRPGREESTTYGRSGRHHWFTVGAIRRSNNVDRWMAAVRRSAALVSVGFQRKAPWYSVETLEPLKPPAPSPLSGRRCRRPQGCCLPGRNWGSGMCFAASSICRPSTFGQGNPVRLGTTRQRQRTAYETRARSRITDLALAKFEMGIKEGSAALQVRTDRSTPTPPPSNRTNELIPIILRLPSPVPRRLPHFHRPKTDKVNATRSTE